VRTPLRFVLRPAVPLLGPGDESDDFTFTFNGREFGWVVLRPLNESDYQPGPTLTTFVDADPDHIGDEAWEAAWDEAVEAAQRVLSAFAFQHDVRMESRPTSGGTGETDLLHPFGARDVRDTIGTQLAVAPSEVTVDPDSQLRLALAVYREGLNAASPFYTFLAFWNVLEVVFGGNGTKRNAFIRAEAPKSYWKVGVKGDVAAYLREESRNAIAHIVRDNPTDTSIDPDLPRDRERLDLETRWLRDLAKKAVEGRWPRPVQVRVPSPPEAE
jgi:hypothetical protein